MLVPAIGSHVTYRNRYGETDLPAIVVVTQASFVKVSDKPIHAEKPKIEAPSSPLHVHLLVFTPGGSYPELDVPGWESNPATDPTGRVYAGDTSVVPARSWRWPDTTNVEHLDLAEHVVSYDPPAAPSS